MPTVNLMEPFFSTQPVSSPEIHSSQMTPACVELDRRQTRTQNKNKLKKQFSRWDGWCRFTKNRDMLVVWGKWWGAEVSEGASLTLWTLRPGQGLDLIVTHWAAWEPHTGFIESESIQEDWQCGSVGLGPSCADPVTWLQFPVIRVKGRRELTPQRCSLTSKAHTCTPTHVHYTHTEIKNEINN